MTAMDGRKDKVTLMAKSRAQKIKIERVYSVDDEVSGVKILEVHKDMPERFSMYKIQNLCCGTEADIQHKTLYYRSRKGVTMCRSCSHKKTLDNRWNSENPRPKPRINPFDKAPRWDLPVCHECSQDEGSDISMRSIAMDVAIEQFRKLTARAE